MKIFIWEYAEHITDRSYYHSGGIVVIASSLGSAKEMISKRCNAACSALSEPPTVEKMLADDSEPCIFIFPDEGPL